MKILLLAVAFLLAGGALAQAPQDAVKQQQERSVTQPGNNAPVWREVRSGEENTTNIKGRETGVLVQSAGDTWRRIRNGPVTFWGGWLVVLVLVAILGFYLWKGPLKLHRPPTGRVITRFSVIEMVVHWSTAISFCVLGLSGLIMLFGKHVLLPIFGYTLFAWLTAQALASHCRSYLRGKLSLMNSTTIAITETMNSGAMKLCRFLHSAASQAKSV
jgi:hypothetical protein